jgi:multimeric flavodoxin WrbA
VTVLFIFRSKPTMLDSRQPALPKRHRYLTIGFACRSAPIPKDRERRIIQVEDVEAKNFYGVLAGTVKTMKIVVLNGSPKGMTSVTMQYVLFLKKKLPQHEFAILNVCQEIRKLEDNQQAFQEVLSSVAASDGVLWAFPLYYMLVHGNYKRFIELLFARGAGEAFKNKYTAVLTTSIHFFDHAAHDYMNGICDDLGMKFIASYSAAMDDLLKEQERDRFLLFADDFFHAIENGIATPRRFRPVVHDALSYEPGPPATKTDTFDKNIIIVSDADDSASNLAKMVAHLQDCFQGQATVPNLHRIRMKGGCLGCCQCGLDNVCVYKDADDVCEVYRKLMAADVAILAGSVLDRYWSSRWKLFFDRGFFMNHVPIFAGKQMGCLVAGPLGQLATLRQILEGYVETQEANLVGIVTDECGSSQELDRLLEGFAKRLVDYAAAGYVRPPTFVGVAARKLFRDQIWAELRFLFRQDHRYYKSHGLYDFPRRSLKTRIVDAGFALLLMIPPFRREFRKRIREEMIKPLQKVVENS